MPAPLIVGIVGEDNTTGDGCITAIQADTTTDFCGGIAANLATAHIQCCGFIDINTSASIVNAVAFGFFR